MLRVVSSPNPFLGKHAAAFQVVSSLLLPVRLSRLLAGQ